MDAPFTSDALIRPWRTATLVASLIAAVELVLLIGLGVLVLAKPVSHALHRHATSVAAAEKTTKAAAKAPVVHRTVAAVAHLPRAKTGVLVLNGNGRQGAAAEESSRLHGLGYPVTGAGNAPRSDYATTSVLYRPGFQGEATRLAHDLGVHAVGPLDGLTVAKLHGGKLAVILGAA